MAKSRKSKKPSSSSSSSSVKKGISLAERIAKWLVVIALSGAALAVLIAAVAAVLIATVAVPMLKRVITGLRASPAMHGSTKDKCVAFYTEAAKVLTPVDSAAENAQNASQVAHACATPVQIAQGAKAFDEIASNNLARAAHAAAKHGAAHHADALTSNAKHVAAKQQPTPGGAPEPHTAVTAGTSSAAAAAGLGVHA